MAKSFHYEKAVKARAVNGYIYALPIVHAEKKKVLLSADEKQGDIHIKNTGTYKALIVSDEAKKQLKMKEGDVFTVAPHVARSPYGGDNLPTGPYPDLRLESAEDIMEWQENNPDEFIPLTAQIHYEEVSFIIG
jgi:hypothetical protein